MALRNFSPSVRTVQNKMQEKIESSVNAKPIKEESSTGGWEDIRDYVVEQTEARWGIQPRDPKKEKLIFESFLSRWGSLALPIARYAFEECKGKWKNAPVRVTRFSLASDSYFAMEIADKLKD